MPEQFVGFRAYGGEVAFHRHDHHQIVLPHRGRMEIEIDGGGGAVIAGTGAFISAGTTHTFVATARDRFVVVDVPCSSRTIEPALSTLGRRPFFSVAAAVQGLLDHLDASVRRGGLSTAGQVAWSLLLLEELARPLERRPEPGQAALDRALAFLRAHATEPILAREVAMAAGVSRTRLHVLFQEHLGTTPHAVLVALRLRAAQRLLESTTLSIAEIAVRTGHADQSALTRCFRRHLGSTPGSVRRKVPGGSV